MGSSILASLSEAGGTFCFRSRVSPFPLTRLFPHNVDLECTRAGYCKHLTIRVLRWQVMPTPLDSAYFPHRTKCLYELDPKTEPATEPNPRPGTDPADDGDEGKKRGPKPALRPGRTQREPVHLAGRYHSNWPICPIPVRPSLNQFLCMRTRLHLLRALTAALLLVCFVCMPSWPDTHDSDYPARAYPAFTPAPACGGGSIAHDSMWGTTSAGTSSDSACPRAFANRKA